jgi:membrane fusion protein, multidrug efflux system
MGNTRVFWLSGVGLAAVLLAGCAKQEPAPEPVRAVKLMTVGAQALEFEREFPGEVRARSEARLGFRVPGKLLTRSVEVGQKVRAGQLLAQLDAADYQLAVQASQAQIQAARTQRDLAAADLKRYADLKAQGFISGAELERRDATLRSAQASLDQAQAQSQNQSNQQAYTALRADRSGVVVAVEAEPGQVLAAGTPVVRIADDGPRDVVVSVPEQQVAALKVGQKAWVRQWTGGAGRGAMVREVAASADPLTRTFSVKLGLDGGGQELPLGSTAYITWAKADVAQAPIKLPTSALWAKGQDSAVWVFDAASHTVKAQAVAVATADGNQAVIAAGLKGGEQVVVAGVHVLAEAQKVTVYKEKKASSHDVNADSATKGAVSGALIAPAKGQQP